MSEIFLTDGIFLEQIEDELRLETEKEQRDKILEAASRIPAFSSSQMTVKATEARIEKSKNDFWFWDRTYFPPEVYPDYSPPGFYHKKLIALADLQDKKGHIFMGPRLTAKSSFLKRKCIHSFLFAHRKFIGFGSGTLDVPEEFVNDVYVFLMTNKRIQHDYKINWGKTSSKSGIQCISDQAVNSEGSFIKPLSERKTARGQAKNLIDRFDLIVLTDFENETSPLDPDSIRKRRDRLNEMRSTLEPWGTLLAEGNNFKPETAMNKMKEESEKGVLSKHFEVHVYPAWDPSRPGKSQSVWYSKYPAKSEDEMKDFLQPEDEYDWAGNFQQNPKPRGSDIFPEEYYQEWEALPNDLKAILYTDPNLSKKQKGDTTTTGAMAFSAQMQKFYILPGIICKPYSDPNNLLEDTLMLREDLKKRRQFSRAIGFDGNVSQESHWTYHVRAFSKEKKIPVPPIEYKKYSVDALLKNAEKIYKNSDVFFPPGFKESETGKAFLKQFHPFKGKKAGKKDDAPDWFVCSIEFLYEVGLVHFVSDYNIKNAVYSISSRDLGNRF